MARGFGTTVGSATTDKIVTQLSDGLETNAQRSYSMWVYPDGSGGNDDGRIFEKRESGSQVELCWWDKSGTNINYFADRSSSDGWWKFTFTPSLQWYHLCVTYDAGSTSNNATMYLDGSSQSLTEVSSPSGTISSNTDNYVIGNRGNGQRCFQGRLAEFAVYNGVLTQADVDQLAAGFAPILVRPDLLAEYVPLVRETGSRILGAPTVTGTAVQNHPRIIYPRRSRFVLPSATVASGVAPKFYHHSFHNRAA